MWTFFVCPYLGSVHAHRSEQSHRQTGEAGAAVPHDAPHGLSEAGCVLLLGIHQQRADEERVVGGSEVGAGSALVPDIEQNDLGVSLRHAQSISHQVDRRG